MAVPNIFINNAFQNIHNIAPGSVPKFNITLYIGNIPSDLDNTRFERMIRTFGPVKKWKRGFEKASFGFVEFDDPFIALRTLRVFSSLSRLSDAINVNVKAEENVRLQLRQIEEQVQREATMSRGDNITHYLDREALASVLTELSKYKSVVGDTDGCLRLKALCEKVRMGAFDCFQSSAGQFVSDILLDNKKPPPPPIPIPRAQTMPTVAFDKPPPTSNASNAVVFKIAADLPKKASGAAKEAAGQVKIKRRQKSQISVKNDYENPVEIKAVSGSDHEEGEAAQSTKSEKRSESKEREAPSKKGVSARIPEAEQPGANTNAKRKRKPRSRYSREKRLKYEIKVDCVRTPAEIIKRIPARRKELFKCFVDWEYVEKEKIVEKLNEWVDNKLFEFIGSREEDITDYVSELLRNRKKPKKIVKKMRKILDEDAEDFVLKLIRRLLFDIIFEKQKCLKKMTIKK